MKLINYLGIFAASFLISGASAGEAVIAPPGTTASAHKPKDPEGMRLHTLCGGPDIYANDIKKYTDCREWYSAEKKKQTRRGPKSSAEVRPRVARPPKNMNPVCLSAALS